MPASLAGWRQARRSASADLALALTALWLGRLCSRTEYAAGFIFMRRMGSAALTATGPVLNVLPLAVTIDAGKRWRSWPRVLPDS